MPRSDTRWIAHAFAIPRALRPWLADRGSLTRRLRSRCARFAVQRCATGVGRVYFDERDRVGLRAGAMPYRRDVLLQCNGRAVVYAHSVVPRSGLRGGWQRVTRLGARPLGEALFDDHRVRRCALRFRRLDARDPLYRAARAAHVDVGRTLWARRSVFCLNRHPLLVSEVFLPGITTP